MINTLNTSDAGTLIYTYTHTNLYPAFQSFTWMTSSAEGYSGFTRRKCVSRSGRVRFADGPGEFTKSHNKSHVG